MPLASADLASATTTLVYEVPSDRRAAVNLSVCARMQTVAVRLALTSGGEPTDADWIEYDAALAAGAVLERTQLWLSAGERIYARASADGVSVVVHGPEETV